MTRQKRQEQKKQQKRLMRIRITTSLVVMVAVLALAVVGIWWIGRQMTPAFEVEALPEQVSVEEAHQLYDEGALLIDVRTEEEYASFHIPETLSIPLDVLEDQLQYLPTNLDLVVVCRTGNRSADGREVLLEAGFLRVTSMDGGVIDWAEAGFPLEGNDVQADR